MGCCRIVCITLALQSLFGAVCFVDDFESTETKQRGKFIVTVI